MQLSDADREQLYDLLSQHAAAGRITIAELELRVGRVAEADTREDATAVLSDLPPLPGGSPAPWWRTQPHGETARPAVDWQPTNERFRDPRTQRIMRVWISADGARHYVPDQPD